MVHFHLGDLHADLAGDGRQKPVHLAVQPQRLDHFGAEHLQRATVVVKRHAGGPRDQLVGNHRRQASRDERILAVLAPAAHDVVALVDQGDHRRNVARVVLEVAVGGHHQPATGGRNAGRKRRGLAKVAAEADHPQQRVAGLQRRELLERVVRTPIVHDQQFVGTAVLTQRLCQLLIEGLDVGRLVVDGDDDRKLRLH